VSGEAGTPGGGGPALTWAEREVLGALRRLARAQAHVAVDPTSAAVDPAQDQFARRELEAAWAEWRAVQALDLDLGPALGVQSLTREPDIDLTRPPASTSSPSDPAPAS
jgi:hypothetical protein